MRDHQGIHTLSKPPLELHCSLRSLIFNTALSWCHPSTVILLEDMHGLAAWVLLLQVAITLSTAYTIELFDNSACTANANTVTCNGGCCDAPNANYKSARYTPLSDAQLLCLYAQQGCVGYQSEAHNPACLISFDSIGSASVSTHCREEKLHLGRFDGRTSRKSSTNIGSDAHIGEDQHPLVGSETDA